MRTEIKELHQRLKTTTVYVTHDQIEAMTMADVIVILRDGTIEQIGKPLAVYDRPANLFVAQFIGSPAMNMLSGEVQARDGRLELRTESLAVPLPEGFGLAPGQAVVLGIRPEHLKLDPGPGEIRATVSTVEPTGPEIHFYLDAGGTGLCCVTQERTDLPPGAEVGLSLRPDRIHIFDQASGRRLEARPN